MSIHCVKIVNEALGCFKMLKITISDLKTNEDFFFFKVSQFYILYFKHSGNPGNRICAQQLIKYKVEMLIFPV